jgi:hypothetical protein
MITKKMAKTVICIIAIILFVLDPCKVGQIYENKLGLNNFTAKWEKEEPTVPKIAWQYCRKASERDKQQPAGSTTLRHRFTSDGKRSIWTRAMMV